MHNMTWRGGKLKMRRISPARLPVLRQSMKGLLGQAHQSLTSLLNSRQWLHGSGHRSPPPRGLGQPGGLFGFLLTVSVAMLQDVAPEVRGYVQIRRT